MVDETISNFLETCDVHLFVYWKLIALFPRGVERLGMLQKCMMAHSSYSRLKYRESHHDISSHWLLVRCENIRELQQMYARKIHMGESACLLSNDTL